MTMSLPKLTPPVIPADRSPRPRMAKAVLEDRRKAESVPIGHALRRMLALVGWSLKEFAGAVGRNERQVARWLDGSERAQLDTLFAVEALRQPLVQALAELAEAEVVVTVRLRRQL